MEITFIIILSVLLSVSLYWNYRLYGYVKLLQAACRHIGETAMKQTMIGCLAGIVLFEVIKRTILNKSDNAQNPNNIP